MSIKHIITEEIESFLSEIQTSGTGIKTYDYTEESEGRFHIRILEPQKSLDAIFLVLFSKVGTEEDKAYEISFKPLHGNYSDETGFGVQFRLLATISKIVKEQMPRYNPNIFRFQPVKKSDRNLRGSRSDSQRMMLYLQYVKGGAGEDWDSFIIGDNYKVNVEKRKPSFRLENGYQDQETIQDIITQCSVYGGYYEADEVSRNSSDYQKFSMTSYGDFRIDDNSNGYGGTVSARKFVDKILSNPFVKYIEGSREPNPLPRPARTAATRQPSGEVPIEPVVRAGRQQAQAMMGTFPHFLQTQVYGNPEYEILDPYFETLKSLSDFEALRERASLSASRAAQRNDVERLNGIVAAIDAMRAHYGQYRRQYGVNESLDVLNEIEETLLDK